MVAPTTSLADRRAHANDQASSLSPADFAASADKVDCERGAIDQQFPSRSSQPVTGCSTLLRFVVLLGLVFLVQHFWPFPSLLQWESESVAGLDDLCPQVEALTPPQHEALLRSLDQEFGSTEFKLKAYESLGGAVRIPTESYDDLGLPSEDPRWEIEAKFHEYLESRFPKVHANLKRTKELQTVKPLLLAAHMDVVPVNPSTYDDWTNPPYSGYYDGEWIWGRGSCDDKPGVIGILTAIETLLERGFVPSRTVLLAFGVDEEVTGHEGAGAINKYLLEAYGTDSIAMLVDEGGGYDDLGGTVFATPAVAEKGYMDIRMDVLTPGGHSSRPPKHTGIGILADLITELEAHPHEPELARGRTYYQGLECRAKYDTSFPASMKKLVQQSQTSDAKLRELQDVLIDFDPMFYAMSGTTQAIDLIGGGVKVNALPEAVWAVANYRIADYSSPAELMDRLIDIILPVAAKHNMTLEAFGKTMGLKGPSWGTIRLSDAYNTSLAPAPVTPTTGSGPYELLSGTIRSTLETHLRKDSLPMTAIVSPGLLNGNTDTLYYWNLTKHIFRYSHLGAADAFNGEHTINEAIRAEGFLEQIRFLTRLILNADQSDLLE
ncbi:hypothetical protein EV363DRAFT_1425979 [Boletus edulis]|nr:hypothetical protein EV363DRAFT_1425979 [Boletus edulis]